VVALSEEGLLQAWGNSVIDFIIYYCLSKIYYYLYMICKFYVYAFPYGVELESYEFT
jgi:hypothetical protein